MDGRNGMEGQAGCRQKERLTNVFQKTSREIVLDAISGIVKRNPARGNNVIISCRKRKKQKERVAAVHMVDILRVSVIVC